MAYLTSITTSVYQTRVRILDSYLTLGRITSVDKNFYPRVKSKVSLSSVHENTFCLSKATLRISDQDMNCVYPKYSYNLISDRSSSKL